MAVHDDKYYRSLEPRSARYEVADTTVAQLKMRVSPNGTKIWSLIVELPRTKAGRVLRRMKIGSYPTTSLKDARSKARIALGKVEAGGDPTKKKVELREATLVQNVIEAYEQEKVGDKRTAARSVELLRKHLAPIINERVVEVDQQTIQKIIDQIRSGASGRGGKKRSAPAAKLKVQHRRVFEIIRAAFRLAVRKRLIKTDEDPTLGMVVAVKRSPRRRYLSEAEIVNFWAGLEASQHMEWMTKQALRIALVTGQRIGEVCGATTNEVDTNAKIWTIPEGRTKNGLEHRLPLSNLACKLFNEAIQNRPNADTDYIFPSRKRARIGEKVVIQPLAPAAVPKAMLRDLETLGIASNPATPHDLRRTVASHMARLGVPSHIASRCLNHVSDVARTVTQIFYDQHSYANEMREAMDRWAAEIEQIITPAESADIVPLRGSRKVVR